MAAISTGTGPVRWLTSRYRSVSSDSFPISRGMGPFDAVVVEVQPLEPAQPGHRRRQGSREPAALQRDRGDAAVAAACHADEGAGAWVAGGVPGAEDPAGRVQRPLERRQHAGVLLVARGGAEDGEEQEQEGKRQEGAEAEAEARGGHGSRGLEAAEREG